MPASSARPLRWCGGGKCPGASQIKKAAATAMVSADCAAASAPKNSADGHQTARAFKPMKTTLADRDAVVKHATLDL